MSFRLLLCAATVAEIEPTVGWLRERADSTAENVLSFPRTEIEVLFTGVGPAATAFALGYRLGAGPAVGLAVQAGVGGALTRELTLGDVVRISHDRYADLGAEAADGSLLDLNDLGLPSSPAARANLTLHPPPASIPLPFPAVPALTVARATGTDASAARLRQRYPDARIESMEGAAFFDACVRCGVEPLQLRAVSNYVELRNRDAWRLGLAVKNLNETLRRVLEPFVG